MRAPIHNAQLGDLRFSLAGLSESEGSKGRAASQSTSEEFRRTEDSSSWVSETAAGQVVRSWTVGSSWLIECADSVYLC